MAPPQLRVLEALLFGEFAARAGVASQLSVLLQDAPLRFDREGLQAVLAQMSTGDSVAYAITLSGPIITRLLTLATLPLRLCRVEQTMMRGGVQVMVRYGVDPSIEAPVCVYELNSPASDYADRCLRPYGSVQALRRLLAHWFGCDPARGGIVVLAKKL